MTCKDCIHYEACHDMYYEEHATRHFDPEKHNAEKECGYFKDRSRFVELPCKPRDMIYRICPINEGEKCCNCPWEFSDCYDIGFQSSCRYHSIRVSKAGNVGWIAKRIPFFGEIYFLTREEAEQALKERESNAERNDI